MRVFYKNTFLRDFSFSKGYYLLKNSIFEMEQIKFSYGIRRKKNITENLERYSVVRTLNAVERSDIAILLIDATEGVTEQDTKVIGFAKEQNKSLIIAVNKWDLIVKDNKIINRIYTYPLLT